MIHLFISRFVWAGLTASLLALMPLPTWAGPGAHGPNGEHLDAPTTGQANAMQASLQIEATSDLFELVATLTGGTLSIFIDRFASNEPVLQAQVEVESGGLKAQAAAAPSRSAWHHPQFPSHGHRPSMPSGCAVLHPAPDRRQHTARHGRQVG